MVMGRRGLSSLSHSFPCGYEKVVLDLGPLTSAKTSVTTGRIQSSPAALKRRQLGQVTEQCHALPFPG